MVVSGHDLSVATGGGVTELDASTGALVRVISGSSYQFYGAHAMAVSGHDLFVANTAGSSVTELPA
jgi:hypothetical protein